MNLLWKQPASFAVSCLLFMNCRIQNSSGGFRTASRSWESGSTFHGYYILVSRRHVGELHELYDDERRAYFEEMCQLAKVIADCFRPHKLNYELLGNQVPHLHWHLFPRYRHDRNLLQPVWLALDRAEHDEVERLRLQTGPPSRADTAKVLRQGLQSSGLRT